MTHRFLVGSAALFLVSACGGSEKKAEDPANAPKSPGQVCVEEAEVKRQAPLDAPERMDVGLIVVKHSGVKDAGRAISRFREDACLRAQAARKALLASGDWEATHEKYSDEQGPDHGIRGEIHQGNLDPNVAGEAFSLEVDEITQVVSGESGFQVVWRKR